MVDIVSGSLLGASALAILDRVFVDRSDEQYSTTSSSDDGFKISELVLALCIVQGLTECRMFLLRNTLLAPLLLALLMKMYIHFMQVKKSQ